MQKRITIVPGLVVTEAMFEAAADGVARHARDVRPLTWERFTTSAPWTLVPDELGHAYKAEFILRRTRERTYKINLWMRPDRRGSAKPKPHDHRWPFTSRVLRGGYTEDRYTIAGRSVRDNLGVSHRAGGANDMPLNVCHEVTGIHRPGDTLTLMVCGRLTRDTWGYLVDTDTARIVPAAPDPRFTARLRALNPHQR